LQQTLTDPATTAGDGFGTWVAVSGSTIFVGAPGTDSYAGAVYVYGPSRQGAWTLQQTLTDPAATAGDYFDYAVAVSVSGSTIVVGSFGTNSNAGAVYVYGPSRRGAWTLQATLTEPTATAGDSFGGTVAVSGSTIVVGAAGTNSNAGAAYVYGPSRQGAWTLQATLTEPTPAAGDYFGVAVAVSGSTIVVGAPGTNSGGARPTCTGRDHRLRVLLEVVKGGPARRATRRIRPQPPLVSRGQRHFRDVVA
jgi:hypothetical protein